MRRRRRRDTTRDVVDLVDVIVGIPVVDALEVSRQYGAGLLDADVALCVRAFVTPRAVARAAKKSSRRRHVERPRKLERVELLRTEVETS